MQRTLDTSTLTLNFQEKSKTLIDAKILSFKLQLCMYLSIYLQPIHVLDHMNLIAKWGGTYFMFVHTLFEFLISLPLFITYILVGFMTRKSFIRFWRVFPLFSGIAYTVSIHLLINCSIGSSYAGLAALLLAHNMKRDLVAINCHFKAASSKCVPRHNKKNYTEACCLKPPCKVEFIFSSYNYYKTFSYADPESPESHGESVPFVYGWTLIVIAIWSFIFALCFIQRDRFRTFVVYITFGIGCIFALVTIVSVIRTVRYEDNTELNTGRLSNLINPELYIDAYNHASYFVRPGVFIYYGTLSHPTTDPIIMAPITFVIVLMLLNASSTWLSMGIQAIQHHYNVFDIRCLKMTGSDLLFAIAPDLLSGRKFPQVYLCVYFLLIIIWSTQPCYILTRSHVETYLVAFPKLRRYRSLVLSIICSLCCISTIMFTDPHFKGYYKDLKEIGIPCLCSLYPLIVWTAIAFYSINRILTDYHFFYGKRIYRYWEYGFRISYWCIFLETINFCFNAEKYLFKRKDDRSPWRNVIATIICLVPFFLGMIYFFFKLLIRRINPIKCSPDFGPMDPEIKEWRQVFDPLTQVRAQMGRPICKHPCLMYSQRLEALAAIMENRLVDSYKEYLQLMRDKDKTLHQYLDSSSAELKSVDWKEDSKKKRSTLNFSPFVKIRKM